MDFKNEASTVLTVLRQEDAVSAIETLAEVMKSVREGALEEAATLCTEHADGYRKLQVAAREAGDIPGALAHLCEKDASLMLAAEIRKLKER